MYMYIYIALMNYDIHYNKGNTEVLLVLQQQYIIL